MDHQSNTVCYTFLWHHIRMEQVEAVRVALDAGHVERLGDGTFGETWKVQKPLSHDGVFAVKILRPEHFDKRLLQREVDSLMGFNHPGILKLHAVEEIEVNGVTQQALICDFIEGKNVAEAVRQAGRPDHDQVYEFALGLLGAVAELHSKGRLHRDIKPENIMLRSTNWAAPILIDFGLSRSVDGGTMTVYPQRIGTPLWMSPEQLRGKKARKAADLWAVGITLYELLTGRHPFLTDLNLGQLEVEDLIDMVSTEFDPLPEAVPAPLRRVVARLINADAPGLRGSAKRAVRELKGAL